MRLRSASRWLAGGAAAAAASYAVYAGAAWRRYGRPRPAGEDEADPLLDRFVPTYDVVERHSIRVAAPAEVTFAAAGRIDLSDSALLRSVFRAREIVLGATHTDVPRRGLLAQTKELGWGLLAEIPGREIVMGAVTRPWDPNPKFRALPPDDFAAFDEPGYVKIAWTLRADDAGEGASIHRSETRAVATDAVARRKFRRYWAAFSAGVALIRYVALRLVRREAEREVGREPPSPGRIRAAPGGAPPQRLELS